MGFEDEVCFCYLRHRAVICDTAQLVFHMTLNIPVPFACCYLRHRAVGFPHDIEHTDLLLSGGTFCKAFNQGITLLICRILSIIYF